jgi:ATP/maltotriose-dependent transcriptional regulator MalT
MVGEGVKVDFAKDVDWGAYGSSLLAFVHWQLGEVDRARQMIEQAKARADASHDVFTLAAMYSFRVIWEALRGDAEGTQRDAETLAEISAMLGVPVFSIQATMLRGWARAQQGDRKAGLKELRQGLADSVEQKALLALQFYEGLLAELEAEGGSADSALARIDEGRRSPSRLANVGPTPSCTHPRRHPLER